MTRITADLLNDTLNIIALAREAAMAKGKQAQAERFTPVEKELRTLVSGSRESKPAGEAATPGLMGHSGFQALLSAARSGSQPADSLAAALERNRVVSAMASGGMSDIDIARHMGMTREEVRVILTLKP